MSNSGSSTVRNLKELAALYAPPTERSVKIVHDHVETAGRAFIAASPFLVLATGSGEGLDCSPKGDQPGFVAVSDDGRTLFIPDRLGNNMIESLKNLIEDPRVALIFFVPAANETYRVNGRARISADTELKRRFAIQGNEPATVMIVSVEQVIPNCSKALVRSNLWNAASGNRPEGVPTFGDFVAARCPETDAAGFDAGCRYRKVGTSTKKSSRKGARIVGVPNYDVPIFRPTEWELRNAFWHGGKKTEKMKKAIRGGFLGRTVHVYARTKIEAAMRAEAENPGWQADSQLVRDLR
jgi:uncharacterized protein